MQSLLTQRDAAIRLALSTRTLERLRCIGEGPRFIRCGRSIRYRLDDLAAWIDARVVGSTSEEIRT
jgi:hypothetical protein